MAEADRIEADVAIVGVGPVGRVCCAERLRSELRTAALRPLEVAA